ncbi:MAG: GlsB/YeaQ/YmgE family stress response membrane protein [Balneolales bacterium]
MNIILLLVLGAAAGVLALYTYFGKTPDNPWQWVGAIVIGLLGGWVGGLLASAIGLETANWIGSLVIAFVGALLIIMLFQKIAPGQRV